MKTIWYNLQPKQSISSLQLSKNPAVPGPSIPPLGIAGHPVVVVVAAVEVTPVEVCPVEVEDVDVEVDVEDVVVCSF